jgi:hypothetical protein
MIPAAFAAMNKAGLASKKPSRVSLGTSMRLPLQTMTYDERRCACRRVRFAKEKAALKGRFSHSVSL